MIKDFATELLTVLSLIIVFVMIGFYLRMTFKEYDQTISISIDTTEYYQIVTNDVQNWRVQNGLPQFDLSNTDLCDAAETRATEIQTDWSHNGWREQNTANYAGENLSKDFDNPHDVLPAWLNSPKHKDNLERNYKYMCIRCIDNYCSQEFSSKL